MIKVFTELEIEEIKKDFKDGYCSVLENYQYGNFSLGIWQDGDGVMISLISDDGNANSYVNNVEFREFLDVENGLEKYINEILYYYNFVENEEEEC